MGDEFEDDADYRRVAAVVDEVSGWVLAGK